MASIKDVADMAQVSIGTASRALRNIGYVSEDVCKRVKTAADSLGYVASYSAQSLKLASREMTIGIVISESNNDYFYKVIALINKQLKSKQIRILVTYSSSDRKEEENNIKYLISNHVSAILFVPNSAHNDKLFSLAKKNNITTIQLFVNVYKGLHTVINDDEMGSTLATRHLIESGCKRILLLDAPYKNIDPTTVSPNRRAGLNNVTADIDTKVINYNPYDDPDYETLKSILDDYNPDGVIAGIGKTGQQLIALSHSGKYSYKFITFDDNSWFECYGISAIRQNTQQLVDRICDIVLNPPPQPSFFRIPVQLLVRNT